VLQCDAIKCLVSCQTKFVCVCVCVCACGTYAFVCVSDCGGGGGGEWRGFYSQTKGWVSLSLFTHFCVWIHGGVWGGGVLLRWEGSVSCLRKYKSVWVCVGGADLCVWDICVCVCACVFREGGGEGSTHKLKGVCLSLCLLTFACGYIAAAVTVCVT